MKIHYRFSRITSLLLGAATVFLASTQLVRAEELLHIGYESGTISPQPGVEAEKPKAADSISVDCSVARVGKCSLRSTLRRNDSYISYGNYRAETETKDLTPLRYSPGESYRYGFSFRTDEHWQFDNRESIDTIWQFKRFDSHADMFITIKGHDVVLRVLKSDQYVIKRNFQPGQWMDIRMDVLWSNETNGTVTVYLRDEDEKSYRRVVEFKGPNMYNSSPMFGRPKWGLYKPGFQKSNFDGPRIVFHDEIMIDKLN
jgi:hypothetical protein